MTKAMLQRGVRAGIWLLLCGVPTMFLTEGPLRAQGPPRPIISWWESPWWNSPLAQGLNLTEAQKTDINGIVKDYRAKMMDLRTSMEKADKDVAAAFTENPVDPRKANDAIEKLATARGDLTRTLSQMSLKLRMVLTAEQWQDLQQKTMEGQSSRGMGRGRRGDGGRPGQGPPPSATKQ